MTVSKMLSEKVTHTRTNEDGGLGIDVALAEVHQRWHPWRRKYELFLRLGASIFQTHQRMLNKPT